jgi:hypothetical protein
VVSKGGNDFVFVGLFDHFDKSVAGYADLPQKALEEQTRENDGCGVAANFEAGNRLRKDGVKVSGKPWRDIERKGAHVDMYNKTTAKHDVNDLGALVALNCAAVFIGKPRDRVLALWAFREHCSLRIGPSH